MQILIHSCYSVKIDLGGTTTYTVVSELDDPTWPCIECLPKVVLDFVGEQSRVHIMPISAKWKHKSSIHIGFIVFNGGVTTFFCQECTFRENREFVFIIIVQFMVSANIRISFGLQIVLVCLYSTPSHYHHCTNLSEVIRNL